MYAGEVQRRGSQGPAPEEGLRWNVLDQEARADLGLPSVRDRGRGMSAEDRKEGGQGSPGARKVIILVGTTQQLH